jgi:hypothetical protein
MFTDVVVLADTSHIMCGECNLLSLLTSNMRKKSSRFKFKLVRSKRADFYTTNGYTAEKLHGDWTGNLLSDKPMTENFSFFEVQLQQTSTGEVDGSYIGISDGPDHSSFYGHMTSSICAIYTSNECNIAAAPFISVTTANQEFAAFRHNSVIGVVVDKITDELRFYLDGGLVGIGTTKPSQFKDIYVFIAMFYKDAKISIVDNTNTLNLFPLFRIYYFHSSSIDSKVCVQIWFV